MQHETQKMLEEVDIAPLEVSRYPEIVIRFPCGSTLYTTHEWEARKQQIQLLGPQTEKVLGGPSVEVDVSVQDANHFATIANGDLQILFSIYGNLFTIIMLDNIDVPETLSAKIVPILEASGYVYVSADDLYQPYSGSNERYIGKAWWYRFFDYM